MYLKPLKLTEEPHWEADTLILQVQTTPPLIENDFTLRVSGTGAKQMASHLQKDALLLLFSPTQTSLALRYSANNRLYIIDAEEETQIEIEERNIQGENNLEGAHR